MSDKQTLEVYDQKAAEYADLTENDTADRQLRCFMDALPAKASVLDLGCGPGRSAALMAAEGHRVLATDASAEMVALAQAHRGVTARQETFDALQGTACFDGVWANFSLLHADRDALPRHLTAIATALKPGGVFHIGMKTGTDTKRDGLGRRYTYVTRNELLDLLGAVGLEPCAQWEGEDLGLDGVMAEWIVLQARKHG